MLHSLLTYYFKINAVLGLSLQSSKLLDSLFALQNKKKVTEF